MTMKQQWWYKQIKTGTKVYIILFIIDLIIEMFQAVNAGERVSVLGFGIKSVINNNGSNFDFSVTLRTIIIYIIFIGLWLLLSWGIKKFRSNKSVA